MIPFSFESIFLSSFVASAAFFCTDDHPEQCYSLPKLGATGTVLLGTVIYYATCPARCEKGCAGDKAVRVAEAP